MIFYTIQQLFSCDNMFEAGTVKWSRKRTMFENRKSFSLRLKRQRRENGGRGDNISLDFCCSVECASWSRRPRFPELERHDEVGFTRRLLSTLTLSSTSSCLNERVCRNPFCAALCRLLTPCAVLNKYFPPDFDPDLIPRRKQPKNSQQVVRLMAPFSM